MTTPDVFDLDIGALDSLTIEEIEFIEEKAGVPLDQFMASNVPKGKMLRCLAYVTMRRDDPEFTWEDAGKMRVEMSGQEREVPPTGAAES